MKKIAMVAFTFSVAMISAPTWAQTGGGFSSSVACGPACAPTTSPGTGTPVSGTPGATLPTFPSLPTTPPTLGSAVGCPAPAGLGSGTASLGRSGLGARFRNDD